MLDASYIIHDTFPILNLQRAILDTIHVPRLRTDAQRQYNVSAVSGTFEGTFDNYVASLIHHWQSEDDDKLSQLTTMLESLGLTARVAAQPLNDAQIELRVARHRKSDDMVSIADVGFGVSQVMPVLVALLAARPGQLVYIEQPELHLHPRAQVALASALADAANRGVRLVIETHSSLLLIALQTLIAEGKLAPEKTMLHWFTLDEDGNTQVDSREPDADGAYGDWPQDFGDVELRAENAYLNAVEKRHFGEPG